MRQLGQHQKKGRMGKSLKKRDAATAAGAAAVEVATALTAGATAAILGKADTAPLAKQLRAGLDPPPVPGKGSTLLTTTVAVSNYEPLSVCSDSATTMAATTTTLLYDFTLPQQ